MVEQSRLIDELGLLTSERRNPDSMDLDLLTTYEILKKLNDEDKTVAYAVSKIIPEIILAVNKIVEAFAQGGRLIYIGAGTSGRLGVLDAVECPPTFSVSNKQVIGIIAGGEQAIYKAVEGAEDSVALARADLQEVALTAADVVVGIAASGRTPYAISALIYAKEVGATAVGLSCNPDTALLKTANISLCAEVGPEVLTGSTRLKSGTAQKLILNMLSTASMVKSGKCYQNLMVDVHASNEKLNARAVNIVMQATDCDYISGKQALIDAENSVKLAILMVLTGLDIEQAKSSLSSNKDQLRQAIKQAND
jgi:N-acetylmuramic acid 6-phosphate etherase